MHEKKHSLKKILLKNIPIAFYECESRSINNGIGEKHIKAEKNMDNLRHNSINIEKNNKTDGYIDVLKLEDFLKKMISNLITISAVQFHDCANIVQSTVLTTHNNALSVSVIDGPLKHATSEHTIFIKDIDKNANLFYFLQERMNSSSFIFCSTKRMNFQNVMEIRIARKSTKYWLVERVNEMFSVSGSNYAVLEDHIVKNKQIFYLCDDVIIDDGNFVVFVDEGKSTCTIPKAFDERVHLFRLLSLVYAEENFKMRCDINSYLRECLGLTENDIYSSFLTLFNECCIKNSSLCKNVPNSSNKCTSHVNTSNKCVDVRQIKIKSANGLSMALTKQLLLLLQDILTISLPYILIGPTGTGKTSILQQLLDPVVFSCSNDTDIIDFMGTYRDKFRFLPGPFHKAAINGSYILFDEINLLGKDSLNYIEYLARDGMFYDHLSQIIRFDKTTVFGCMNKEGKKNISTRAFVKITVNDFSEYLDDVVLVVNSFDFDPGVFGTKQNVALFYHEVSKKKKASGRTLARLLKSECTFIGVYTLFEERYNNYRIDLDIMNFDYSWFVSNNGQFESSDVISKTTSTCQSSLSHFGPDSMHGMHTAMILTDTLKIMLLQLQFCIKHRFPVLLFGETSTGKTTLVYNLSRAYGRKLVRINNHKDTDITDYLGRTVMVRDRIIYAKGALVQAMVNGDWLLIDEINLCSCDVLEILNRLLDDNNEIKIPETGETVKPSPSFRIFASMNTNYAGRNKLSDAFLNRFVVKELKIDLKEILSDNKYKYIRDLYEYLRCVRNYRSLITLRDVFKIIRRSKYECIRNTVIEYLGGRQRDAQTKTYIRQAIDHCDKINTVDDIHELCSICATDAERKNTASTYTCVEHFNCANCLIRYFHNMISAAQIENCNFLFTKQHIMILTRVLKAWYHREHVLLVGETGIGKTRMVQVLSEVLKMKLTIVACHGGMDSSDLIGQFEIDGNNNIYFHESELVSAIRKRGIVLLDEINLPDSNVIERLNSLLDSDTLYLTETNETIQNQSLIVATMNPGTYSGKKELSDALRNRFTEIFFDFDDYKSIINFHFGQVVHQNTDNNMSGPSMLDCLLPLKNRLSIRVIERMMEFYNTDGCLAKRTRDEYESRTEMFLEACEITGLTETRRKISYRMINDDEKIGYHPYYLVRPSNNSAENVDCMPKNEQLSGNMHMLAIEHRFVPERTAFRFTTHNFYVLLRALFLSKNILIEGAPGLGKTSVIKELGRLLNRPVERINLNVCTEFSDLIGTYVPYKDKFVYVESSFVKALRENKIVILDEINLCTASVIEGLNPLLDHRKSLLVGHDVITTDSPIIGTMNPSSYKGRKTLPKSFLDRFVRIKFVDFSGEELNEILGTDIASMKSQYGCSMRDCIRARMLGNNIICNKNVKYRIDALKMMIGQTTLRLDPHSKINSSHARREDSRTDNPSINHETMLPVNGYGNLLYNQDIHSCNDSNFVFTSTNVKHVESLINAIWYKVPVIMTGMGKSSVLCYVANILKLKVGHVYFHNQMDTCDLLGQYEKVSRHGKTLFEWKDSRLVQSLNNDITVMHTPEQIDGSIIDRINSLLDDNYLNIIEKGIDTYYQSKTRFVCLVDNIELLSQPFIDRCLVIKCEEPRTIDYVKILSSHFDIHHASGCMMDGNEKDTLSSASVTSDSMKEDGYGKCMYNRIDDIVSKAEILLFLCKKKACSTLLSNLHVKLKINTYNELIDELFEYFMNDDEAKSVYTLYSMDKTRYLLPNLVLEKNIKKYYNYCIVRLTREERKTVSAYRAIRSCFTNMTSSECVRILKRDNIGLKEQIEYVNALCKYRVKSAKELKEKYICIDDEHFKRVRAGSGDEYGTAPCNKCPDIISNVSVTEENGLNSSANAISKNTESIKIRQNDCLSTEGEVLPLERGSQVIAEKDASLEDLPHMDVVAFKDSKIRYSRSLFSKFMKSDPLNLLIKECDALPDIRTILVKLYKYAHAKSTGNIMAFLEEAKRKIKKKKELIGEQAKRDYAGFTEWIVQVEEYIKTMHITGSSTKRQNTFIDLILNEKHIDVYLYYRLKIVKLARKHKKMPLEKYKEILIDCYYSPEKRLDVYLENIKGMQMYTFTQGFCMFFYHVFFKKSTGMVFPFVVEMIKNGYEVPEKIINDGIIDKKNSIDHACIADYRLLLYILLNDWKAETIESFMVVYSYSHFQTVIHFLKTLVLSKYDMKYKKLFYNISLQYYTFNYNIKNDINALEVINDVDMLYETKCYNCCDALKTICQTIKIEISDANVKCMCIGIRKSTGIPDARGVRQAIAQNIALIGQSETELSKDADIKINEDNTPNIHLFYEREIPMVPYSDSEVALGKLFFKFNLVKNTLKNNVHNLVILCFYCPYIPLIMYVYRMMQECDTKVVDDGRVRGKGDIEDAENDSSENNDEHEEEEGDNLCNSNSCGEEENDGNMRDLQNSDEQDGASNGDEIDGNNEIDLKCVDEVIDETDNDGVSSSKTDDLDGNADETEHGDGMDEDMASTNDSMSDGCSDMAGSVSGHSDANGSDCSQTDTSSVSASSDLDCLEESEYSLGEGCRNYEQCCDDAENYESGGAKKDGGRGQTMDASNGDETNEKQSQFYSNDIDDSNKEPERNDGGQDENNQHDNSMKTMFGFEVDQHLVERLKNIMFSKKKYRGDYRTGKKLNLKKIVQYIASDYQKDKIWLRKENDNASNVRLFIDNSKSMTNYDLDKLCFVYRRLHGSFLFLNVPLELYKFGSSYVQITSTSELTFDECVTNYSFIDDFHDGVNIVLTDGIVTELENRTNTNFLFLIFNKEILNMETIRYIGNKMIRNKYLDNIKFKYEIVGDAAEIEDNILLALEEIVMEHT